MRLAVLVRDGVQRPGMESLETIWADPETRTVAQAADAAVKELAVGVSREQVLEDLGHSPVQSQRITGTAPTRRSSATLPRRSRDRHPPRPD